MELHLITWSEMAYREKKKDEEKDWPKLGREISQLGSSEICGFGQHKAAADIWACGFYDKCYPALYANHTMEKRSVAPNSSSKVFLSRKEKKKWWGAQHPWGLWLYWMFLYLCMYSVCSSVDSIDRPLVAKVWHTFSPRIFWYSLVACSIKSLRAYICIWTLGACPRQNCPYQYLSKLAFILHSLIWTSCYNTVRVQAHKPLG